MQYKNKTTILVIPKLPPLNVYIHKVSKEFEAFLFTIYRGKWIPERPQPTLTNQIQEIVSVTIERYYLTNIKIKLIGY